MAGTWHSASLSQALLKPRNEEQAAVISIVLSTYYTLIG